jgi:hypothetical protein
MEDYDRALFEEYTSKLRVLNKRLINVQYSLVHLDGSLKVQVLENNQVKRVLGLEYVDRKLRTLSGKENVSPRDGREAELNRVLFETIELVSKLRLQCDSLK